MIDLAAARLVACSSELSSEPIALAINADGWAVLRLGEQVHSLGRGLACGSQCPVARLMLR